MVVNKNGTETKLCYVSLTVQSFHGWSGQGGECECVGAWFGAVGSEWTKLTVAVCG